MEQEGWSTQLPAPCNRWDLGQEVHTTETHLCAVWAAVCTSTARLPHSWAAPGSWWPILPAPVLWHTHPNDPGPTSGGLSPRLSPHAVHLLRMSSAGQL